MAAHPTANMDVSRGYVERMKKVLWKGTQQLEFVDDGTGPPPLSKPDDVRIRVTASGVCGTDVHIVEGRVRFVEPPLVLGHEVAGVVDECGPDVRKFLPGDRVKCDSVIGCGCCAWCENGATQFCPNGSEVGMTRDGGWAEWLVVPERNLHPLPDSITDEVAAILDVEVFGALRKPGVNPGDSVVVLGPGPGGLIAVQLARLMDAGTIILCGTRAERLQLGKKLGADHVIDVTKEDPVAAVQSLTGGRGADLAFEATGSEKAALQLLEILRPQGRGVLYGVHGRPIRELPIDRIVLKDLVIYGALSNRTGWEELIGLVADGKLDLASLITHTFPLSQAAEGVACTRERREGAIKAVLLVAPTSRKAAP